MEKGIKDKSFVQDVLMSFSEKSNLIERVSFKQEPDESNESS